MNSCREYIVGQQRIATHEGSEPTQGLQAPLIVSIQSVAGVVVGKLFDVKLVDDPPPVLPSGKLSDELGYSYTWKPREHPQLSNRRSDSRMLL